jgi:hypothetical protein
MALVGGGTASALVLSHHGTPRPSAAGRHAAGHRTATGRQTPSTVPSVNSAPSSTPSPLSPSPTFSVPATTAPPTSSPGNGQVEMAGSVAANPQAPQIIAFLDSYFGAINSHSYPAYRALLASKERHALTNAEFQNGYATTKDSAETLQRISVSQLGDTVAHVTFISHQNAADSVNGSETCTSWNVALYLQQDGDGYLLGQSPPGYHASYAAC